MIKQIAIWEKRFRLKRTEGRATEASSWKKKVRSKGASIKNRPWQDWAGIDDYYTNSWRTVIGEVAFISNALHASCFVALVSLLTEQVEPFVDLPDYQLHTCRHTYLRFLHFSLIRSLASLSLFPVARYIFVICCEIFRQIWKVRANWLV